MTLRRTGLQRRTELARTPLRRKKAIARVAAAKRTVAKQQNLRDSTLRDDRPIHPSIRRGNGRFDPEQRFWDRVSEGPVPSIRPDLGPCLIHSGADNGNGYVQFSYNGTGSYAHRYAWERVHGPIPADMTVDHLCEVKRCVNVEHFTLATCVDNYLRTALAKAACQNGHPYLPGTYRMKRGARLCLICARDAAERGQARRRRVANGLPDRRVNYDQDLVRAEIAKVRAAEATIASAARAIGCNPNYLGRRVWRETRVDVLARDGGRCVRCGGEALDVHHRIARGSGGASLPEIAFGIANLVSLCRTCHSWVHEHPAVARDAGLTLRRSETSNEHPVLLHPGRWVYLTHTGEYAVGAP